MTIKEIEKICENYNMYHNVMNDTVFIRTDKAEWYFYLSETSNIRLFHNNYFRYGSSSKFINSFHVQKKRFNSYKDIIDYIYNHDKAIYKKKVKKSRMDYLFEKIEKQNKYVNAVC